MGVNGIYGLSGSGMDIESLVKVGMMSKQNEYDKMAQKFTKNEWIKSDYLELSSQINTFNISTLSQYKQTSTMKAKSAETSATEFKATVGSSAPLMNHKVQVETMAANAYLVGTNKLTRYDTTTGEAYSSTDEESSSILLKDVLFKELTDDGTNVHGKVAGTDLDMEETSRDKGANARSEDGVKVTPAYKFGYADEVVSSHWNINGTEGTPVDTKLRSAYKDTPEGEGNWRYQISGSVSAGTATYYWARYDSSSDSWKKADINDYASEFKTFIDSHPNTYGYTWVPETTNLAMDENGDLSRDEIAFKFTLSDGVTKDGDDLKTFDVEYTYAQLLDEGITLNDLASKINSSGLNIRASYDSVHDLFSLYNTKTGEDNTITIEIGTDTSYKGSRAALTTRNFLNNLGLYSSVSGELYDKDGNPAKETDASTILFNLSKTGKSDGVNEFKGVDSKIKVDGVTYTGQDNKVSVGGVTYTALSEMTSAANVSITQDTDAIIDKVKSFVEDYNKLLSSLYEKYDEKPNSDYKPLTQSQKDGMKEEQITKWEEKAKKGMLYHDQTIGKIIQNMRSAVTNNIELDDGTSVSIFSLGISTTGLKGQLKLDEDKLKQALDKDPDIVYNVFAKLDSEHLDDAGKSGVAQRLGDVFVNATKSIKSRAGSSADISEDSDLNNLLRNLQTRMSNFKKMMTSFENALYKKYDAMESALAKLGTQLNYIMGGNS